jgi:hypothetical protein
VPLPSVYKHEAPRKISEEEKEFEAFRTLRTTRGIARNEGARKAKAAKASGSSLMGNFVTDHVCRRRRRRTRRRSSFTHYSVFVVPACPRVPYHVLCQNRGRPPRWFYALWICSRLSCVGIGQAVRSMLYEPEWASTRQLATDSRHHVRDAPTVCSAPFCLHLCARFTS